MRRPIYYIIGITMLLFASCGQQHQAKEVIEDFIALYATDPAERGPISIQKFDSTKVINDSVIRMIRINADTIQRYRKPVNYGKEHVGRKLFIARISYSQSNTEYSETYYLDEQLTHVIAFKSN